ncbi:MAG: alpha/beta hydrolase [Alphaproteobacteria bacterium]
METFITNTAGDKICVRVRAAENQCAVVLIEHGLAGYKEEGMIETLSDAFFAKGVTVVTFDARYGLGRSDGALEKACFTHFIEDFETVAAWMRTQVFYQEPFYAAGHSLGAGSALFFAARHPQQVAAVVCVSSVISGKLLYDSYLSARPDFLHAWQKNKFLPRVRADNPARTGCISYDHMTDALKYDVRQEAAHITAPVLIIYGNRDISSTALINKALYRSLRVPARLVELPDCGHTYARLENRQGLRLAVEEWLDEIMVAKREKRS